MTHLHTAPTTWRRLRRIARQRGLTLIELMVALVVGLMVILAAMSVFSATSRSAGTVDAAGQLRDNARFAADIIQRLAVQTGFEDINFVTRTYQGTPQAYRAVNGSADPLTMQAPISGLDGHVPGDTLPAITEGAASFNGSDTLVLRYQSVNRGNSEADADGSMMLCDGSALAEGDGHSSTFRNHRAISIFYVAQDATDNEPTLYCRYANREDGSLSQPVALVKGVESFKVLYGVDNIAPNQPADCNGSANCDTEHAKLVPSRYLTAADMAVSGDAAATQTNWRRVRTLRIGLVLRAGDKPIQSGQALDTRTIHPLGEGFDAGSYPVSDARLRRNYVFTINVRNCLNQGYQSAGDPGANAAPDVPPCDVVVPRV